MVNVQPNLIKKSAKELKKKRNAKGPPALFYDGISLTLESNQGIQRTE